MAHRTPAPVELVEYAAEHGWTVTEFLPDRFDACASTTTAAGTVTVTRESRTRRWMWSLDRGANWGRGNRVGRADTLTAATAAALATAEADSDTLF